LIRARRRLWSLARKSTTLKRVRRRLIGTPQRVYLRFADKRGGEHHSGVRPENVVWIFGSGRSGSTWLRNMMGEIKSYRVWEEPLVGRLFGEFYEKAHEGQLRRPDFIMGEPTRKGWTRSVRNFVLDGARYSHPGLDRENYLVVKEPNGSIGAPLIMEALPESRMILLIRDPRDVVASNLDGAKRGNWLFEWAGQGDQNRKALASENPDAFVRRRARMFANQARGAIRAYYSHKGPKVLVYYEDLLADTVGEMRRVYAELGLPLDQKQLSRAVERHSWENIPEEQKGEGKFYRRAEPGGWKEELTEKQVQIVEEVAAPILEEFYPDSSR
jgi:hypothetical protein